MPGKASQETNDETKCIRSIFQCFRWYSGSAFKEPRIALLCWACSSLTADVATTSFSISLAFWDEWGICYSNKHYRYAFDKSSLKVSVRIFFLRIFLFLFALNDCLVDGMSILKLYKRRIQSILLAKWKKKTHTRANRSRINQTAWKTANWYYIFTFPWNGSNGSRRRKRTHVTDEYTCEREYRRSKVRKMKLIDVCKRIAICQRFIQCLFTSSSFATATTQLKLSKRKLIFLNWLKTYIHDFVFENNSILRKKIWICIIDSIHPKWLKKWTKHLSSGDYFSY